jgi:hypothetical protein
MMVRIETPCSGVSATGAGTKVTTMDGHEIKGIAAIDLRIRPNEPTQATLGIWCAFLGEARSDFVVTDPETGDLRSVKRIEFTDGGSWDADPKA